jgi:hypothetical protein
MSGVILAALACLNDHVGPFDFPSRGLLPAALIINAIAAHCSGSYLTFLIN